jgi:thymidylate synthase ThyX
LISAKIIAHSISPAGQSIVTWELEYPRFIHGEFMTHRLFSRNAASSRAIPVAAMIQAVKDSPAKPIHWGANQPGMQASQQLTGEAREEVEDNWMLASSSACMWAEAMAELGAHKQIANRILEPFQTMKTVMTATCMDNFFWLRNHEDAQPEIKELARLMWEALQASAARKLHPGWWHVPYFHNGYWCPFMLDEDCYDDPHTLEEALAISSSCCAQVSYRKLDDTLEKAEMIYKRLVESEPVHASPFEHQATPYKAVYEGSRDINELLCVAGTTHVDAFGRVWSGNFVGWIQHRQLIPNNVCMQYKENK